MKPITMDGKYVLSDDHHTPVRILCIDAPGPEPVVSISAVGQVYKRKADGTRAGMVPIALAGPDRLWKVSWPDGTWTAYDYEEDAMAYASRAEGNVTEFVEAEE